MIQLKKVTKTFDGFRALDQLTMKSKHNLGLSD